MYCGVETVAENIDEWRGNLVTRIKQYASRNSDIQLTANSAISSSDLNACSFSTVSARLDHFAERLNQQDQIISDNNVKIQSLVSSFDQFQLLSECQFSSLKDQLRVVNKAPGVEGRFVQPLLPVEVPGVEQDEVIEGLRGKVQGLEQTILTEQNAVEGLQEMVVGLNEKVDSSLDTALSSNSNTSGPVSAGCINLVRERDIVRKGIECSEKLILQLISTRIPNDYVDIALIRKCNTFDLPALQSALQKPVRNLC